MLKLSKKGKKVTPPICLPEPSVHQGSWKTSVHQHPAVAPSHPWLSSERTAQIPSRCSLKGPSRCFWRLWERKSEQLEVSGGCLAAQSSGFLEFPQRASLRWTHRPHADCWEAVSHQCPDVSRRLHGCLLSGPGQAQGRGHQVQRSVPCSAQSCSCRLLVFRHTRRSLATASSGLRLAFSLLMQKSATQWPKLNSDCDPGLKLLQWFKLLNESDQIWPSGSQF